MEMKKTWPAELRIGLLRQKTTGTMLVICYDSQVMCHKSFLAHGQRTQANCPNFILHSSFHPFVEHQNICFS